MSEAARLAIVCAGAAGLRAVIHFVWQYYKRSKMSEPIPMRLRNGVHEPWGSVQKVQRVCYHLTTAYALFIAFVVAVLIYRWFE